MLPAPIPKSVNVVLDSFTLGIDRRVVLLHALDQQRRVVDTLRAGQDLLATHEEVVGVGELGVFGARHGVKGPHGEWVLVEDVEVRSILVKDEFAQ